MKKLQIISILLLLIGSGCTNVQVPTSQYKFGTIALSLPKDITAKGISVNVKSGTNTLVFKAEYITSQNNPGVIAASAEGQADLIKAHYEGTSKLTDAAIKAAAKSVVPVP